MQKTPIIIIVLVLVLGGAFFLSQQKAEAPIPQDQQAAMPAATAESAQLSDGTYVIDPAASTVSWQGRKTLVKDYKHDGTLSLASGNIVVAQGAPASGSLTFDMRSMTTGNERLLGHLKSDDFFGVEKFPTATLAITGSTKTATGFDLAGNLTIKGVSAPVVIPVTVTQGAGEGVVVAAGALEVDRTAYGIRYGSANFFSDLGDNVIDDFFTVSFSVSGARQ
jgi:polyisoprenoid-binding protein YceI